MAVRVAGVACCGVVESGERAALEVDMARGSYSEAERSELPQLALPMLRWGVGIPWRWLRSRPVR